MDESTELSPISTSVIPNTPMLEPDDRSFVFLYKRYFGEASVEKKPLSSMELGTWHDIREDAMESVDELVRNCAGTGSWQSGLKEDEVWYLTSITPKDEVKYTILSGNHRFVVWTKQLVNKDANLCLCF
jgi:hypothetical protein